MAELIEVITAPQLLSYLQKDDVLVAADVQGKVDLANGLVSEAWKNPVDPIPYWVTSIALEVAGRPVRNPNGLESWTRSVDDASRTERLPKIAAQAGVFLTVAERRRLNGRKRSLMGSIRTRPGY